MKVDKLILVAIFVLGVLIGILIGLPIGAYTGEKDSNNSWTKQALERGFAEYDSKTGVLKWVD